jgi:hypothetical protein
VTVNATLGDADAVVNGPAILRSTSIQVVASIDRNISA